MPKRKKSKKIIAEILFWLHLAIMIFLVACGLFIPLVWVLILLVVWRIHLLIFHACFISIMEQKEGGIPKGKGFIWLVTKRFFGINLSHDAVRRISQIEALLGLIIAAWANLAHFRIHL